MISLLVDGPAENITSAGFDTSEVLYWFPQVQV